MRSNILERLFIKKVMAAFQVSFLSCMMLNCAQAFELNESNFRVNGFATFGLTKADNDQISSRNQISQKGVYDDWSASIDSRAGIQLDFLPTDKLHFSLQLIAADREDNSLNKSIQSAYIGYDLTPSLELKLGRTATSFLLLSDYKQVGYAQLWAHLPAEFYGQTATDYGDGLLLIHKTSIFNGVLRTQAWFSTSKLNYFTSEMLTLDIKQSYGLNLTWEGDAWSYSFAYGVLKFIDKMDTSRDLREPLIASIPLWPEARGLANKFGLDHSTGYYYGASVGFNKNDWIMRTELSLSRTKSFINDTKSAYVLVGRRFGQVTPYLIAAKIKNDRTIIADTAPPLLNDLQVYTQIYANYFHYNQKTISLGMRWDIQPRVALKGQWDHTWIAPYGGGLNQYKYQPNEDSETTNRFTITLDFCFDETDAYYHFNVFLNGDDTCCS